MKKDNKIYNKLSKEAIFLEEEDRNSVWRIVLEFCNWIIIILFIVLATIFAVLLSVSTNLFLYNMHVYLSLKVSI